MFETLFENRNRALLSLIKLGDCLGRSLRENTILFSINSDNGSVIYLTENKKVILGNYKIDKPSISLHNIQIKDTELFEDSELFNNLVDNRVSEFVASILNEDLDEANISFTDVLNLWENQIKFNSFYNKLSEKSLKFNSTNKIIDEDSFQKFIEAAPQIIEFLRLNKKSLSKIPEIENSVRVSNIISEAFDFPRITYEELIEETKYTIPLSMNESVYEIICNQELIKQELLESKKDFDTAWATNKKVRSLATLIYDSDEKIIEKLSEVFTEVPYIALTTKKQLYKVITNSLHSLSEDIDFTPKDIKEYVSKLFEMKKSIKKELLEYINKTYGINTQNLNEVPTFKSLIDTQVVIFETLSKLSSKSSIYKNILNEVATMLKAKTGVESIDVNTYLVAIFDEAGYLDEYEIDSCVESFDIKGSAEKINELNSIVETIKKGYKLDEVKTKEKPKEKTKKKESDTKKEEPKTGNKEAGEESGTEHPDENPDEDSATEDELDATEAPEIITKEDFLSNLEDLESLLADLQDELENSNKETGDEEKEETKPVGEAKEEEVKEKFKKNKKFKFDPKKKGKKEELEDKEDNGDDENDEDEGKEDEDKEKEDFKDKLKKKKKSKKKSKEETSETEDEQYNEEKESK